MLQTQTIAVFFLEQIFKIIIIVHSSLTSDMYFMKNEKFKQKWLFLNLEEAIHINELELSVYLQYKKVFWHKNKKYLKLSQPHANSFRAISDLCI